MTEQNPSPEVDVSAFIFEKVDSVPHLEAIILVWNSRPVAWTVEDLASRLYLGNEQVHALLCDLVRLQLVKETPGTPVKFSYLTGSEERDALMAKLDEAYRRDLVRISTVIHSKASSPVREFARAFRFKKEQA